VRHGLALLAAPAAVLLLASGAPAAAARETSAGTLEPGRRLEGRIGGEEQTAYEVRLAKGDFAHVVVDQRGVDLIVSVRDPAGRLVVERDALTGAFGPEVVRFVAPSAGAYRVGLRVLDPHAVRDRFLIRLEARRPARPEDRPVLEAQRQSIEGARLRSIDDAASIPKATAALERAQALWHAAGDRYEEALAFYELGSVARGHGDNPLALKRFLTGLDLARAAGDRQLEARVCDSIGLTKVFIGDAEGAAAVLTRSMALAQSVGDLQTENEARNTLGWAESNLGHYQRAIEIYTQAIAVARSRKDRFGEAWPSNGLALAYLRIGERRKALTTYERALELWRSLEDRRGEVVALEDVGFLYWVAGDASRALEIFERVLPIARTLGDGRAEALALNNMGLARITLGDPEAGRRDLVAALAIWRRMSDQPGECQTLHNLGRAEEALGRAERALALWREELALHRASSDPNGESGALTAIAGQEAELGGLAAAREHAEASLAILERERLNLSERALRSSFLSARQNAYAVLVEILMRLAESGRDASSDLARDAFSVTERGRARTFLEALAASSPERAPGPAKGGIAPGTAPAVASVASVASVQARLASDAALVSFWLASDRAVAFVVERGRFRVVPLLVSPADLAERIGVYTDLLSRGATAPAAAVGRRLYADVVAPWRAGLAPGVRRLVLVPDRALHSLPFEALADGSDRPLLSDYSVSYAPSSSVFALRRPDVRKAVAPVAILALAHGPRSGHPAGSHETVTAFDGESFELAPLAHADQEARRAVRFGGEGSRVLTGDDATEPRWIAERPERFGVLHFATHGLLSVRSPDRSALRLTEGRGSEGLLEARAIYGLRLSSDLVVLSACQSARGLVLPGEGVESLARAFFQAGAKTVVATLWNVQDERAAELMDVFYMRLASGEAKADALRSAKLELLRRHPGLPPTLWAPFVLIGEPDGVVPLAQPPWWRGLL
jgi:CHAT domain-containing protein